MVLASEMSSSEIKSPDIFVQITLMREWNEWKEFAVLFRHQAKTGLKISFPHSIRIVWITTHKLHIGFIGTEPKVCDFFSQSEMTMQSNEDHWYNFERNKHFNPKVARLWCKNYEKIRFMLTLILVSTADAMTISSSEAIPLIFLLLLWSIFCSFLFEAISIVFSRFLATISISWLCTTDFVWILIFLLEFFLYSKYDRSN